MQEFSPQITQIKEQVPYQQIIQIYQFFLKYKFVDSCLRRNDKKFTTVSLRLLPLPLFRNGVSSVCQDERFFDLLAVYAQLH